MSSLSSRDMNNKTLNETFMQYKEVTSFSKKEENSDYISNSIYCGMDVIERKSYYADVKPRPSLSSYKNNHSITSQNGGSDFKYLALSRRINLNNLNSHMSENCSIKKNYLKSVSMNDGLHRDGKNVFSNGKNLKCIPESQPTQNTLNLKDMNKLKVDQDVNIKNRGINKWNSSVSLNINKKSNTSKLNDPCLNDYLINNISSYEKLNTIKNSIKNENKITNKVISKNAFHKNNEKYTNNIKVKSEGDKCVSKDTINTLVSIQTNSVMIKSLTTTKDNTDSSIHSKTITNNTIITDNIACNSNQQSSRYKDLNSNNKNNLKNTNSKSTSSINITKNNMKLDNKNPCTNKTTTNSTNTSIYNRTISSDSSSSCISRRLLPNMVVSEKVLEEKRNVLSKRLEQKMIRKVSSKCRKEIIKNLEDSEENRSMTSYEVAGIMERAGPMGVYESDYEENCVSVGEEEEEEDMYKSKKNKMTSLFDAMKNDLLISDDDDDDDDDEMKGCGDKTLCHQFKQPTQVNNQPIRGFMPYSKLNIPSEVNSDIQSISLKNNIPTQTDNSSQNHPPHPLSLFAILQSASFILIPMVISPEQYAIKTFNNLHNSWKLDECPLKLSRKTICLEISTKTIKTRNRVVKKNYSGMLIDESFITAATLQQPQENIHKGDVLLEVNACVVGSESCLQIQRHIINLISSNSNIHLVLARKDKI